MTFVKVRLQIEKMSADETLEVRLEGAEPLRNVPESVTELGHAILSVEPEGPGDSPNSGDANGAVHRLLIEKRS